VHHGIDINGDTTTTIIIIIIIIINSGSTRPGATNKILCDKNIEHRDRQQVQTLPTI